MNTEIIILYDIYGSLLTSKQKLYFEDYYFKNLSLSEIGDKYGVSRNAIHKQLKISENKLKEYENVLNINKKENLIKDIIENIDDLSIKDKLSKILGG